MRYYNLIEGDKEIDFKIPESWNEVSFSKYLEYIKMLEENKENVETLYNKIYSLFTGLEESIFSKNLDISVYMVIDEALAFITKEPKTELPTDIERNGVYYPINEDFLNLPLGKYRDILAIIGEADRTSKSLEISIIPKMVSVLACDGYDTEDELEEIAKDLEAMPCDELLTIGGFFLSKLKRSKIGTKRKLSAKDSHTHNNKRATVRLSKITAFFIRSTTWLTVILRNTLKFLNRKLPTYIALYSYKVVSVTQTRDILT